MPPKKTETLKYERPFNTNILIVCKYITFIQTWSKVYFMP